MLKNKSNYISQSYTPIQIEYLQNFNFLRKIEQRTKQIK